MSGPIQELVESEASKHPHGVRQATPEIMGARPYQGDRIRTIGVRVRGGGDELRTCGQRQQHVPDEPRSLVRIEVRRPGEDRDEGFMPCLIEIGRHTEGVL